MAVLPTPGSPISTGLFLVRRQHLNRAANFLIAADNRIELALARRLRKIARVFFQRVIGIFSSGKIGGTAFAQRVDGCVEFSAASHPPAPRFFRLAVLFQREREQQALDSDETVAGLSPAFPPRQRPAPAPDPGRSGPRRRHDLRPLKRRFYCPQRLARIAA